MANSDERRMGWRSTLTVVAAASLVFETITGLAIAYAPFHAAVEWSVIVHTAIGVLTLLPICWYYAAHWQETLGFLKILTETWPAVLDGEGEFSQALLRTRDLSVPTTEQHEGTDKEDQRE